MILRSRTASTDSVSSRLSELPRSCEISNSACTSWRAAAMEAEEVHRRRRCWTCSGGRRRSLRIRRRAPVAALHLYFGRELRRCSSCRAPGLSSPARRNGAASRSTTCGSNALPDSSCTIFMASSSGRSAAILAVRGERVQAIDRGQNARADGNVFAREAVGITAAIPFFVMRAHDGDHRIGELHALQNFRAHDRDGSSSSRTLRASGGRVWK